MQNSSPLSFSDFVVANPTQQSDDLLVWRAKQRKLDEGVSKRAHAATAHAEKVTDSAQGAAGADLSRHPAADAHAKAYDLHKSAARLHGLYHRKTGDAESEKKATEHRKLAAYHREHLVALGAIHEEIEISEDILDEKVESNNPNHGYHGEKPEKYSATHAKVKKIAGEAGHLASAKHPNKMVRHYLDSVHGRHLAGNEYDHEYIKKDFHRFAKKYDPSLHEAFDLNEGADYRVAVHHFHPDKRKETFHYDVKNAVDHHHANYIALEKHRNRKIPAHSYHSSSMDAVPVDKKSNLKEDGHIFRLKLKQPPIAKPERKTDKIVDNVANMRNNCALCGKLGKPHSILNHLRNAAISESVIDEAASKHPKHIVSVGYDIPDHEDRFQRFTQRHVDVKVHAASKEDAIAKAHAHVEKKGHRVLHSHHIGTVPVSSNS